MSESLLIRTSLGVQISEQSFQGAFCGASSFYQAFLDDAAQRLSNSMLSPIEDLIVAIRSDGPQRVRLDGSAIAGGQSMTFYAAIVWLPKSKTFRGKVSVNQTRPKPPEKTVDDFITALDAIRDENVTIFVGQVFDAMEGLDENNPEIVRSYPAIFRLFERFPEEGFGNPGHLVHLLSIRGGHESLLAESLHRSPSIPALELAHELAYDATSSPERVFWLEEISRIAVCAETPQGVRAQAELCMDWARKQNLWDHSGSDKASG